MIKAIYASGVSKRKLEKKPATTPNKRGSVYDKQEKEME
jgi:hypothetical protein